MYEYFLFYIQAQQVGLMTDYHQFLITTLDMHTIDLEPYQYSGTNITSIRMVDPESEIVQQVATFISESESSNGEEVLEGNRESAYNFQVFPRVFGKFFSFKISFLY